VSKGFQSCEAIEMIEWIPIAHIARQRVQACALGMTGEGSATGKFFLCEVLQHTKTMLH
jgi:hypothetical protein